MDFSGEGLSWGSRQIAQTLQFLGLNDIASRTLGGILAVTGIIAVIAIIVAGLLLLTRGSEPQWRQRALRAILYTVAGILVIWLSGSLVAFLWQILYTVEQ